MSRKQIKATGAPRQPETRAPWTQERRAKYAATMAARDEAWSAEETTIARNLWERGVYSGEIAETVNRMFRKGRTGNSVMGRMHKIGAVYASRVEPDEAEEYASRATGATAAMLRAASRGGAAKAEMLAAQARAPYHPLHDNPKLKAVLGLSS